MNNHYEPLERTMRLSLFTIEHAPDGVVWIDSEGHVYHVNETVCRMFGRSRDEIIGAYAHEFHQEVKKETWIERWGELWRTLKDKKVLTYEQSHLTKDGRLIPIEVTQHFIEFEGVEYSCVFFRDITERKRAEEDLRNALAEVERLKNRLQEENIYLRQEIQLTHNFEDIISRSEVFKGVLRHIEQVASTDATVLVLGETGTGKELVARAIHSISNRQGRPLVKVNCAALPANLIESELFGHEKGAFTGALARKIGRFELADGGTILLDEIGDLSPDLQVKLLRVLQEGEFERVGNPKTIKVDVRIIAATNRDLEQSIKGGTFREDLFYRLNIFPIRIPPLRERKEDIPLLVNHFVQKYSSKVGKRIETVSQKVMERLQAYYWPGNVRELENIIERAVIISRGPHLELDDWFSPKEASSEVSQLATLEEVERAHIVKALQFTRWRVSGTKGAAEILGMNPYTLVSRMKKLEISRPT